MFRSRSAVVRAVVQPVVRAAGHAAVLVAVLGLAAMASAQATWRPTGSLAFTSQGDTASLHTFATQVPKDLASRVDDPQAKAVAEKVAGTEQHTATWMLTDPVKVGGSVMVPARLFVIVDARAQADPNSDAARVHLEFGLDPSTGELLQDADRTVAFHPAPYRERAFYETSDATVTLDDVHRVDASTLAVSGHVSAVLEPRGDALAGAGPLKVTATFELREVAGDSLTEDLLTRSP